MQEHLSEVSMRQGKQSKYCGYHMTFNFNKADISQKLSSILQNYEYM